MSYCVEKYDVGECWGDDGEWEHVATVEKPMELRPVLRQLYESGYDRVSISVTREEEDHDDH